MSIILDFRLPEQILPLFGEGFCYQQIEGTLGVYYVDRTLQPPLSASQYLYRYIPQLYGLEAFPDAGSAGFDLQPLEVSGILAQQRPPLELTGRLGSDQPDGRSAGGVCLWDAVYKRADQCSPGKRRSAGRGAAYGRDRPWHGAGQRRGGEPSGRRRVLYGSRS